MRRKNERDRSWEKREGEIFTPISAAGAAGAHVKSAGSRRAVLSHNCLLFLQRVKKNLRKSAPKCSPSLGFVCSQTWRKLFLCSWRSLSAHFSLTPSGFCCCWIWKRLLPSFLLLLLLFSYLIAADWLIFTAVCNWRLVRDCLLILFLDSLFSSLFLLSGGQIGSAAAADGDANVDDGWEKGKERKGNERFDGWSPI